MKTLKQFREDNGLADIKPKTDVAGTEGELLNDLAELLRKNANAFRKIFNHCLNSGLSTDEENGLKQLIGIMGHLKDSPKEAKNKLRDPMDNVVVRPHAGPDGSGGGDIGGGE